MANYFSLKNPNKNIKNYKQNKMMNLSSSRPNLNSFRIKKIFNEFNKDKDGHIFKIKKIERNKTENFMDINTNISSNIENDNIYNQSNIMRSNSFLHGSSNFNFDAKKSLMSNFDINRHTINRKNTDIFYQGLPNFKMDYNVYDSNIINLSKVNKPINKNHRAQTRDYYNYNSIRENNNYEMYD